MADEEQTTQDPVDEPSAETEGEEQIGENAATTADVQPEPAEPDTPEAEPEQPQGPSSALSLAIATLQRERGEIWDRLLRTAAEYDNYKKRSKRDAREGASRAADRVVLEFLPVIDNMERALAHAEEESGALVDGVRMVYKQFLTTLEKFGIKPFDSIGTPFDPELHEAIQQMPSEEPVNNVCNELQRGYLRGERLVRPAMVVVSSGPAQERAAPNEGDSSDESEPLDEGETPDDSETPDGAEDASPQAGEQ